MTIIRMRIEGIASPGATCTGPDSIYLGVQREKAVEQVVPSSTPAPVFHLDVEVIEKDGALDQRGPYVHGPKGDRFLYLAWLDGPAGSMVARIKLRFADVPPDLLADLREDSVVNARLPLIDDRGRPRSGSIRPPEVVWSIS